MFMVMFMLIIIIVSLGPRQLSSRLNKTQGYCVKDVCLEPYFKFITRREHEVLLALFHLSK